MDIVWQTRAARAVLKGLEKSPDEKISKHSLAYPLQQCNVAKKSDNAREGCVQASWPLLISNRTRNPVS